MSNEPAPKPPTDHSSRRLWLCLCGLLVASALVRFYKLHRIGIEHGDCFVYMVEAYRWSNGVFVNHWAKPGYHLLGAGAISLLGFHDYSLLFLNSACDVINVLLVFVIAKRIGATAWCALSSALAYAFMPYMILSSRWGFTEIPTATFLLFSFWMLISYLKGDKKPIYLVLSGLAATFAGQIHPTALCVPGFYCAVIFVAHTRRPFCCGQLRSLVIHEGIFLASCAAVFLGLALIIQSSPFNAGTLPEVFRNNLIGTLFRHREEVAVGRSGNLLTKISFSFVQIAKATSVPVFLLVCIALVALLVNMGVQVRRRICGTAHIAFSEQARWLALVWGVLSYFIIANAIFAPTVTFMPLIEMGPFFVLAAFASIEFILIKWKPRKLFALLLITSILVAVANFAVSPNFFHTWLTPTIYRQTARVLGDRLDEQNQLLIAPSSYFSAYDGFQHYLPQYYHRISYDWSIDLLLSKIRELKLRFVLVSTTRIESRVHLFFSVEEEYRVLGEILKEIGAKLIYQSEEVRIYELPGGTYEDLLTPERGKHFTESSFQY